MLACVRAAEAYGGVCDVVMEQRPGADGGVGTLRREALEQVRGTPEAQINMPLGGVQSGLLFFGGSGIPFPNPVPYAWS